MSDLDFVCPDAVFAADLSRLWEKTFHQAYRDEHTMADRQAYCRQHLSESAARAVLTEHRYFCEVAYRLQEAAGFFVLQFHACPFKLHGQSVELKQIYCLSKEYGRGLGHILLNRTIDKARQGGYQWLWLYVSDRNVRARKFYEKEGFTLLGKGVDFYVGGDKLTSSCLALPI